MNITKELEAHAKAIGKVNEKFSSRFRAAYVQTINAKARNIQSMDRIVEENKLLDVRIKELDDAIAVTNN